MKVHPIWDNFQLGEVTSRLWGRDGVGSQAVSKLVNFFVTSQGSIRSRYGTRAVTGYRAHIPGVTDNKVKRVDRVFPLNVSDSLTFAIGFFRRNWGGVNDTLVSIGTSYGEYLWDSFNGGAMTNSNFRNELDDWDLSTNKTGAVDSIVHPGRCTLFSGFDGEVITLSQDLTGNTAAPGGLIIIDVEMPDGNVIFDVILRNPANSIIGRWTINTPGRHQWGGVEIDIEIGGKIQVEFPGDQLTDSGFPNARLELYTVLASLYSSNEGIGKNYDIIGTSTEDLEGVQYVRIPDSPRLVLSHDSITPQEIVYNMGDGTFTFGPYNITNRPGKWTDENGWPRVCGIHQGRLWFANTKAFPNWVWASKPGDFNDFDFGASDAADDAFEFQVARHGEIRWMLSMRNFLIGTSTVEYVVTAESGVISILDIQFNAQSANGSALVQAHPVGNSAVYVTADRKKIRSSYYRWEEDNWKSRDVTFLSEHFLRKEGVRRTAYQNNPDRIIWIVTGVGNLYSITFDDNLEYAGMARHRMGGVVSDVAVVPHNGRDEVYIMNLRMGLSSFDAGETATGWNTVEKMEKGLNVDSAWTVNKVVTGGVPISSTPNMYNMGGVDSSRIWAVVDGVVDSDISVDNTGLITGYDVNADVVDVGFRKSGFFRTLPMDFSTQAGSTPSWKKRWNKIYARLSVHDGHFPTINGNDSAEEQQQLDDVITDVKVANLGVDNQAVIEIEHDKPYDLEIVGIFGEMSQSRL